MGCQHRIIGFATLPHAILRHKLNEYQHVRSNGCNNLQKIFIIRHKKKINARTYSLEHIEIDVEKSFYVKHELLMHYLHRKLSNLQNKNYISTLNQTFIILDISLTYNIVERFIFRLSFDAMQAIANILNLKKKSFNKIYLIKCNSQNVDTFQTNGIVWPIL